MPFTIHATINMKFQLLVDINLQLDLNTWTCGCRRWNLTGLIFHHAIFVMNKIGHHPIDYIHVTYFAKAYRKYYSNKSFEMFFSLPFSLLSYYFA